MRHRTTAAAMVAIVAIGTAGCTSGDGNVAEIPDADDPTPDTTPFIEPVSPPAEEVDRPDESPGEEGGVPEDDPVGTEDGEEGGATD